MTTNIWNMLTSYYITSPAWLILTILALIYILYTLNRSGRQKMLLCALFAILTVLNEVSYALLVRLFDAASYYRFLWTIPYVMVVAYALVHLMRQLWRKKEWGIAVLLALSLVVVLRFSQGDYLQRVLGSVPQNKYQVVNDMPQIRDILDEERAQDHTDAEPVIAAPSAVMLQYQTIDAGCEMVTDRVVYLYVRAIFTTAADASERIADGYLLSTICEDMVQVDVTEARAAIDRQGVDYMIVKTEGNLQEYMTSLDCSLVGTTTQYEVYHVDDVATDSQITGVNGAEDMDDATSYVRTVDVDEVAAIKSELGITEDVIEIDLGGGRYDDSSYG